MAVMVVPRLKLHYRIYLRVTGSGGTASWNHVWVSSRRFTARNWASSG